LRSECRDSPAKSSRWSQRHPNPEAYGHQQKRAHKGSPVWLPDLPFQVLLKPGRRRRFGPLAENRGLILVESLNGRYRTQNLSEVLVNCRIVVNYQDATVACG